MWFIRFRETAWGFFCCCIVFRQRRMLLRIILNFSTRRKKISNYCPLLRFTLYSFLFHLTVSRDVRRTVQSLVSYLVSSNAVTHSKSKVANRIFTSNEMINPFFAHLRSNTTRQNRLHRFPIRRKVLNRRSVKLNKQ